MPQAGAHSVEVRVAVDGQIRRHALALRPGHIAVLTGLRPLDANPGPAAGPSSAGFAAAEPMDLHGPTQALVWTEVRLHACEPPVACTSTSNMHTFLPGAKAYERHESLAEQRPWSSEALVSTTVQDTLSVPFPGCWGF